MQFSYLPVGMPLHAGNFALPLLFPFPFICSHVHSNALAIEISHIGCALPMPLVAQCGICTDFVYLTLSPDTKRRHLQFAYYECSIRCIGFLTLIG